MNNLVSTVCVVVPTFRRLSLLRRCLKSIKQQTRQPNEVRVVAADPEERGLVEKALCEIGLRQAIVVCQTHTLLGGEARNLGWRSSESEIIMFIDDDDYWHPEKVAKHVDRHMESLAEVVYSGVVYTFSSPEQDFVRLPKAPVTSMKRALLLDGFCPATTSCVSVRRSSLEIASGFDEALRSYQDWDLWYRLADFCEFALIPEALTYFVQHSGERVSMTTQFRILAAKQLLEKFGRTQDLSDFFSRELIRTIERALVFSARGGDYRSIENVLWEIKKGNLKLLSWRTYWIGIKVVVYSFNHLLRST